MEGWSGEWPFRPSERQWTAEWRQRSLTVAAIFLFFSAHCNLLASALTTKGKVLEPDSLGITRSNNPFEEPKLKAFLQRFNITLQHGSGVDVDLGQEKEVDGKMYREASGLCPVWGKYIQLYQPDKAPYQNDFLQDVPTEEEYKRAGNPLPGGFNMNYVTPTGQRISPFPMELLEKNSNIKATTELGKCAEFAYKTTAMSKTNAKTDYRYPFVYDSAKRLCYILVISLQRLEGEKYCSTKGSPAGLTWYCLKPNKSTEKFHHLIYGSAYVGKDPEHFVKNCPNQALRGNRFGVWLNGRCRDYTELDDSWIEGVGSKAECWVKTFTNDKVASDQPRTYPLTSQRGWNDWWPLHQPDQPHSRGVGRNYGFFYIDSLGQKKCALSDKPPDCLVSDKNAVSYTAVGSLSEDTPDFVVPLNPSEPIPDQGQALQCTSSDFPETYGACDLESCKRQKTTCIGGQVESTSVDCTETEAKDCGGGVNTALVAGLVVGGVLLIGLLAGGGYYFSKRGDMETGGGGASHNQEYESRRHQKKRPSDLIQEAEPSFWDEAEDDINPQDETQVLVEGEY
ncbi:apical membrane antigen AMA1 [Besnoitia besnoiti]|uniref:Apical membrane antigen AMA1 n=1 Tax=Besnoitia besnoiti TaxID=94643 RepID=A0A2A9MBX4_BESBE|nr:apical membrane antigen AMA1 [Besnoitia besnoiti]PFH33173.1 apical membrane antigen AMA1 [Besnoitia besnoiti]